VEFIKKTAPWYIGGLHFECQGCGDCCSGPEEGFIWITKDEINMLAAHLQISSDELRKKYLRRVGLRFSIKENPQTKDCAFLSGQKGSKGCAVYNFRPMQCRTWPFWPSNLAGEYDWNTAAIRCPGINKGKLYLFEEIQKLKKQKKWWDEPSTL
jgi:Fe-S-cluster containining protein